MGVIVSPYGVVVGVLALEEQHYSTYNKKIN